MFISTPLATILATILAALATTQASEYSATISQRNVEIASAMYCDTSKDWSCSSCVDGVENFNIIEGDSRVAMFNDTVQQAHVIAFRGSSNLENWISNFDFAPVTPYEDKSIEVHRGLYGEYVAYKERILEYLANAGATRVVITGHSAGGALSVFLGFDLKDHPEFGVTVYSYGSPRIGNHEFAQAMKEVDHHRVTHARDLVPHLLPEVFGVIHTGNEVWYPDDTMKFVVCDDADGEDKSCSDSCAPLLCTSTLDHACYLGEMMGKLAHC